MSLLLPSFTGINSESLTCFFQFRSHTPPPSSLCIEGWTLELLEDFSGVSLCLCSLYVVLPHWWLQGSWTSYKLAECFQSSSSERKRESKQKLTFLTFCQKSHSISSYVQFVMVIRVLLNFKGRENRPHLLVGEWQRSGRAGGTRMWGNFWKIFQCLS